MCCYFAFCFFLLGGLYRRSVLYFDMSFAYFHGIVSVDQGHKVQTVRANGSVIWHAVYTAGFALEDSQCKLDGTF